MIRLPHHSGANYTTDDGESPTAEGVEAAASVGAASPFQRTRWRQ